MISAGLTCGAMGLWMIYDSKFGKVRERERYLDKIAWRGDESVITFGSIQSGYVIGSKAGPGSTVCEGQPPC